MRVCMYVWTLTIDATSTYTRLFHFHYTKLSDTAEDDNQNRAGEAIEPRHLQPNPSYCSIEMMKKTQHIAYENVVMQM